MQENPLVLAHAWFGQAVADLSHAVYLLEGGRFELTCFISQQCAEKALKALLVWHVGEKPRRFEISLLCAELSKRTDLDMTPVRDARMLDTFYISSRYPDALAGAMPAGVFVEAQARAAVDMAQTVVDFAAKALPPKPDLEI